jgi:hypothetical protein
MIVETMTNAPKAICAFVERPLSLSAIMVVFTVIRNGGSGVYENRYSVQLETARGRTILARRPRTDGMAPNITFLPGL